MTQNLVPAAVATTKEAQKELLENAGYCAEGELRNIPEHGTPLTGPTEVKATVISRPN